MPAIPARRAQRSAKLCAFHVKNPTGRQAPTSRREPSTRQYVGLRESSGAPEIWRAATLVELGWRSLMGTAAANSRMNQNARISPDAHQDYSHAYPWKTWNDSQPRRAFTQRSGTNRGGLS